MGRQNLFNLLQFTSEAGTVGVTVNWFRLCSLYTGNYLSIYFWLVAVMGSCY